MTPQSFPHHSSACQKTFVAHKQPVHYNSLRPVTQQWTTHPATSTQSGLRRRCLVFSTRKQSIERRVSIVTSEASVWSSFLNSIDNPVEILRVHTQLHRLSQARPRTSPAHDQVCIGKRRLVARRAPPSHTIKLIRSQRAGMYQLWSAYIVSVHRQIWTLCRRSGFVANRHCCRLLPTIAGDIKSW